MPRGHPADDAQRGSWTSTVTLGLVAVLSFAMQACGPQTPLEEVADKPVAAYEPDVRVAAVEAVLMVGGSEHAALGNDAERPFGKRITPLCERLGRGDPRPVDEDVATLAGNHIARKTVGDLGERLRLGAEVLLGDRIMARVEDHIVAPGWEAPGLDEERPVGKRIRRVDHEGVGLAPLLQRSDGRADREHRGNGKQLALRGEPPGLSAGHRPGLPRSRP